MKWVVMRHPNLPADQTVTIPEGSVRGYTELLGFELVPDEVDVEFTDTNQDTGPHDEAAESLSDTPPAEPAPGE